MKNQIKHVWTILAQSTSTDAVNNSFSLFNVIDELVLDLKPVEGKIPVDSKKKEIIAVPANFQIVSLWKKEVNSGINLTGKVKISFVDPDGVELQYIEYPMIIPADKKRMRFVTQVNGINMSVSGEYKFIIKLKESDSADYKEMFELPIDVIIKKHN